MTISNNYRQ